MSEEIRNEKKDECPLSPTAWIMFLSNEFYHQEQKKPKILDISILLVLFTAIVSWWLTHKNLIFAILALVVCFYLIYLILVEYILCFHSKREKGLRNILNLREKIIGGKNNSNEIREEWGEIYRMLYPKKRTNGLEKSEIDEKIGMTRIGSANFWYALGGSCVAIGGVFISRFSSVSGVFWGWVLIIAGLFMLKGAYSAETDSNFFAEPSWKHKGITRNKWLLVSLMLIIICVVIVWIIFLKTLTPQGWGIAHDKKQKFEANSSFKSVTIVF